MKKQYNRNQIADTLSYWTKRINESNSKASLGTRRPDHDPIADYKSELADDSEIEDPLDNGYDKSLSRFSDEMQNAGRRNGYENTWFISNMSMYWRTRPAKPTYPLEELHEYPIAKFIDSCRYHCIAEVHDVEYDSAILMGPGFEIESMAGWARGYEEHCAWFEPDFNKSTITLVDVYHGSWEGSVKPFKFPSKDSQQTLLNDIYRVMPYLEQYEINDPQIITFKLPHSMMQEIEDRLDRSPYAYMWSDDIRQMKQVKLDQIDAMWKTHNKKMDKHIANKAKEIDAMYAAHDKVDECDTYTKEQIAEAIEYWKSQLS